jgi:hypothetical protein
MFRFNSKLLGTPQLITRTLHNNIHINHTQKKIFYIEFIGGCTLLALSKYKLEITNEKINSVDRCIKGSEELENNTIPHIYRFNACNEIILLKPFSLFFTKKKISNDTEKLLNMTNNKRHACGERTKMKIFISNLLISLGLFISGLYSIHIALVG